MDLFETLPDELFAQVLSYLLPEYRPALRAVGRRWRAAADGAPGEPLRLAALAERGHLGLVKWVVGARATPKVVYCAMYGAALGERLDVLEYVARIGPGRLADSEYYQASSVDLGIGTAPIGPYSSPISAFSGFKVRARFNAQNKPVYPLVPLCAIASYAAWTGRASVLRWALAFSESQLLDELDEYRMGLKPSRSSQRLSQLAARSDGLRTLDHKDYEQILSNAVRRLNLDCVRECKAICRLWPFIGAQGFLQAVPVGELALGDPTQQLLAVMRELYSWGNVFLGDVKRARERALRLGNAAVVQYCLELEAPRAQSAAHRGSRWDVEARKS